MLVLQAQSRPGEDNPGLKLVTGELPVTGLGRALENKIGAGLRGKEGVIGYHF